MLIQTPINAALLLYKDSKYPIPSYALGTEATIIAVILLIQLMRYHIGRNSVL